MQNGYLVAYIEMGKYIHIFSVRRLQHYVILSPKLHELQKIIKYIKILVKVCFKIP